MKERPLLFSAPMMRALLDGSKTVTRRISKPKSPYRNWQVGDVIWSRETFWCDAEQPVPNDHPLMFYKANSTFPSGMPWKPSIHQPRWASRYQARIVSIREEPLSLVDRVDAAKEGICGLAGNPPTTPPLWDAKMLDGTYVIQASMWPEENYRRLWDYINGPGSFDSNPMVWRIEFERLNP